MTEEAEPKATGEEERNLKRKQSLEAAVTLGLGYGKKKKRHVEAFYSAVWPLLEEAGWTQVKGEGDDEGATYFLPPPELVIDEGEGQGDAPPTAPTENPAPPQARKSDEEEPWDCTSCGHTNPSDKLLCTGVVGEERCMGWKKGNKESYFNKVRDVIVRVMGRENEVEEKAADAFEELVPDAADMFVDVDESPSRHTRHHMQHFAWKDDARVHFEKASSQVGSEFQVSVLPAAGSYTSTINHEDSADGGPLYERVWHPEVAKAVGKLDFIHTRVQGNRKEAAYDMFHSRGYRLPGFYQEVSSTSPTDCSDWTKEDKDNFRSAVFEHHENMKKVSKMIGKPVSECITYYLVKFKRAKSYKSLKRSMKRKANVSEGSAGTLVCNECGKGGMLIACDTCEAHYHLTCAAPPLESIPEGSWSCGNCKRETRAMLSSDRSQDDTSYSTAEKNPTEGSVDISMEESGDDEKKPPSNPLLGATVYICSGEFEGLSGKLTETAARGWWTVDNPLILKKVKNNCVKFVDDGSTDLCAIKKWYKKRGMMNRMPPITKVRLEEDGEEEESVNESASGMEVENGNDTLKRKVSDTDFAVEPPKRTKALGVDEGTEEVSAHPSEENTQNDVGAAVEEGSGDTPAVDSAQAAEAESSKVEQTNGNSPSRKRMRMDDDANGEVAKTVVGV